MTGRTRRQNCLAYLSLRRDQCPDRSHCYAKETTTCSTRNLRVDDSPPPAELQPRDASNWLGDAEDAIRQAHNQSLPQCKRLALLDEAAHCIEHAKECL